MTALQIVLVAGAVLSFIGTMTSKQVANFLGPKSDSPASYIRILVSVLWFTLGELFCWFAFLLFILGLALTR